MFESMAPEDTRLELLEHLYLEFEDFARLGKMPGFWSRRKLKAYGLLDDSGLSPMGRKFAQPMIHRQCRMIVRQLTAVSIVATVIWVSSEGITCVRHSNKKSLMWRIDACELPALVARLLDFKPREGYECGPRWVHPQIFDAAINCDVRSVEYLLRSAAKAYEKAPEPGAEQTPLSYGLKKRLWTLSLLTRIDDEAEGENDSVGHIMYLSVPESLFRVFPAEDPSSPFEIAMTRPLGEWSEVTALIKALR